MLGLVRLNFDAPVHLGEAGLGLEESAVWLHSDTLFSAIFKTWLQFDGTPPPEGLILSSAFPFLGEEYYFPRPFLRLPGLSREFVDERGKEIKKLRFVPGSYFFKWLKGEPFEKHEVEDLLQKATEVEKAVAAVVRPQVALDRLTRSSGLYFAGETWFKRGAGLFFLVDLPEEEWPRLQETLRLLGEEGIGGRRSLGYGVFRPEFASRFRPEEPGEPDAYLTLSLFYPDKGELTEGSLVAYRLVERTGWLEGTGGNAARRHQRVLMFAEGSVFGSRVRGRLVEVAPPGYDAHPVYRNGRAFTVGARMGGDS